MTHTDIFTSLLTIFRLFCLIFFCKVAKYTIRLVWMMFPSFHSQVWSDSQAAWQDAIVEEAYAVDTKGKSFTIPVGIPNMWMSVGPDVSWFYYDLLKFGQIPFIFLHGKLEHHHF